MKRARDTGESIPSPPTTSVHPAQKKKKKSSSDEEMYKKYIEKIGLLEPTIPDAKIYSKVEAAAPDTIGDIVGELGIAKDNKLIKMIPEDTIKKLVSDIIIEEVNKHVRSLIVFYLPHFMQMKEVVDKVDGMENESISEELNKLKPPGEDEEPFSKFTSAMNNIMVRVVKRVASVIDNKELVRGNNALTNAILDRIEIPRDIKINICKHLSNYILAFAGKDIYAYFLENSNLMNKAAEKYIM